MTMREICDIAYQFETGNVTQRGKALFITWAGCFAYGLVNVAIWNRSQDRVFLECIAVGLLFTVSSPFLVRTRTRSRPLQPDTRATSESSAQAGELIEIFSLPDDELVIEISFDFKLGDPRDLPKEVVTGLEGCAWIDSDTIEEP
jgi:hypothetical protein